MTCADVLDRLDDYEDGLLSEADLHAIELHLAGCDACREESDGSRALLRKAASAAREMDPPRDLWPGIASRIEAEREPAAGRRARRFLSHPSGLAAAAAVVIALASILTRRGSEPAPTPTASATLVPARNGSEHVQAAEVDYIRATGQLMDALNARRSSLSPETQSSVDENLHVIDNALRQVRDALEKDPGNRQLTKMLASTHQKKLDLLLRLLKLSAQI
ncbi:MAG: zf-HC2 domain-containing protein [Vicinamibacteria bacterium]